MTPLLAELTTDPTKWLMIGLAGATILYIVIKPSLKKKKDPLARGPAYASLSRQRSVEREMQNLLVELSDMTRQITAQLDTRSAKLEALIERADRKMAELGSVVELTATRPAAGAAGHPVTAVATVIEPPNITLPLPIDNRHRQVYDLADEGRSAMEIAKTIDRPRGEVELILALRPKSA